VELVWYWYQLTLSLVVAQGTIARATATTKQSRGDSPRRRGPPGSPVSGGAGAVRRCSAWGVQAPQSGVAVFQPQMGSQDLARTQCSPAGLRPRVHRNPARCLSKRPSAGWSPCPYHYTTELQSSRKCVAAAAASNFSNSNPSSNSRIAAAAAAREQAGSKAQERSAESTSCRDQERRDRRSSNTGSQFAS
jgi:hypothetical protein